MKIREYFKFFYVVLILIILNYIENESQYEEVYMGRNWYEKNNLKI